MNNIHKNNVKSANHLTITIGKDHSIKNEELKNYSENLNGFSVANMVGVDKGVISDNEIKEQEDYTSSIENHLNHISN